MIDDSYAEVEPLLADAQQEGEVLHCTFRCPATGEEERASAALVSGRTLEDVSSSETPSLADGLWHAFGGLFRGALAPGPGADTASGDAPEFSASERKAAVLLAFDSVSSRFVRDGVTGRWVACSGASELLSDFARQLGMAPVRRKQDRDVAARMLVEVARADGIVSPVEWAFLTAFVPADMSSVDTCMERPALSDEELGATSRGAARDTMLMLAWALAFVDSDLDRDETGQMLRYARALKVPEARALELRRFAKEHLLEEALRRAYRKGKVRQREHGEALALAAELGLDPAAVEVVEGRLRRRLGLG